MKTTRLINAVLALVCAVMPSAGVQPDTLQRIARKKSPASQVTGPQEHLEAAIAGGATMVYELVPRYSHPSGTYNTGGCYNSAYINGNQLNLVTGQACRTYWNVVLRDWDPDGDTDPRLRGWQGRIDSAGYSNGIGGNLLPADQSCSSESDCTAAFGEAGAPCGNPAAGKCRFAWANTSRPDAFESENPPPDCTQTSFDTGASQPAGPIFFAVTGPDAFALCSMADPHTDVYGGSLALDVPANALGTYTLSWVVIETFAFGPEVNQDEIPILAMLPGVLFVDTPLQMGNCCYGAGTAQEGCAEGVLQLECGDDEPLPAFYVPFGTCPTACDSVFPTGACCSRNGTPETTCTDDATYSECLDHPSPITWTEGALCSEILCEPFFGPPNAFTYQGFLEKDGQPVDGTADFQASIWDDGLTGIELVVPLEFTNIDVVDGAFSIEMDFGTGLFDGSPRWLQLAVRDPSGVGDYTSLSPRVRIRPTPEAFHAQVATSAWALDAPDGAPVEAVFVDDDGRVGIGRDPAANQLEVEGDASKTTAGDWLANSDRAIKTDVRTIQNALQMIERLRPVAFRYSDDYRSAHPSVKAQDYYNYIAQEFREVFPEAVKASGEDGLLQMDSYPASVFTVAAIQELHQIVLEKECQIAELTAQKEREAEVWRQEMSALRAELARVSAMVEKLSAQSAGGAR